MQWSAALIVCVTILTGHADALSVNSSPDRAAVNSGGQPVRQEVVTLLRDSMKQGDADVKEQLKDSITNLKELLQGKDSYLDERMSDVLARSKAQDDQLKEDHEEDIARLKERLTKDLNYLNDLLEEEEVRTNEELSKLKEALGKRPCGDKPSGAGVDDLRQQMANIQSALKTHEETLQTTQVDLNTTRAALQSTQQKAESSEEALQEIRQQLREEQQASTALKAQLQAAEQEIRSLKVEMDSVQSSADLLSSEMGSTFTRWGRTTCPNDTALVYTGYVGGQPYSHSGGGSNYLCLTRDPQLDNMTLPGTYNLMYGTEYEYIEGHHNRDAVCSVCRAPQVTTLMIPATLSCPREWTTQYRGHLMSGHHSHRGRNEFVCLDKVREHRDGGEVSEVGAEFFHIVPVCGSLPCPPYVNKVVTCVVCSR